MKFGRFIAPSIALDLLWQVGGAIINRASYFIALLWLSNYMTKEDYGAFSLLYNLSLSISAILSYGLGVITRREIASGRAKEQQAILMSNLLVIIVLCGFFSGLLSIYHSINNNVGFTPWSFFILLFFLSLGTSISLYLSYHYSGLSLFKEYNRLLLPVNIILPICVYVTQPQYSISAICIITAVTMIGNIVQIAHIKGELAGWDFQFQKKFHKQFYPCFLQSILGLPIYVLLQMIIVERWNDVTLIGNILIATQILNMCNIFATKSLTVLNVSITKALSKPNNTPFPLFAKHFTLYLGLISFIHLAIWFILPIVIALFKYNSAEIISELRHFIAVSVIISSSFFFSEYFHAIKKSWWSLASNIAFSISIFAVFFTLYYHEEKFTLTDYANCLSFARIIPILLCLCVVLKSSTKSLR